MRKKSIGKNAFLNGFRNIMNLLFPLVTFPYVSRVLSVEGVGQYNFAQTSISYFSLLAALGFSTYAIREGARYRDDKYKFSSFASQILFLNTISTIIAYAALAICMICVEKFQSMKSLMWIFSIQIVFITVGIEWLYSVYEEYKYITIRSIAFKIISVALIFLFVRDESDTPIYALITVFASAGSNIFNLLYSRRFFHLKKIRITECIKHIKPILIIFASNVAIMIYVYSDTTMLGFMQSDYTVGIYSVSVKIYSIVKTLLSSILVVSIPRLSMYYDKKMMNEFMLTLQKVYDAISALLLPSVVGMFFMSEQVILFISENSYIEAASSLRILCIALVFCIYSWIFCQCILMPAKQEKQILNATIASAVVNVILNWFLIPLWKENGTAVTTLIAELMMSIICGWYGLKKCNIKLLNNNMHSVFVGCVAVGLTCIIIPLVLNVKNAILLVVTIVVSIFAYALILITLKNTIAMGFLSKTLLKQGRN